MERVTCGWNVSTEEGSWVTGKAGYFSLRNMKMLTQIREEMTKKSNDCKSEIKYLLPIKADGVAVKCYLPLHQGHGCNIKLQGETNMILNFMLTLEGNLKMNYCL